MKKGIGLSVPAFFSKKFINELEKLQETKNGNDYIDNVYGSPRSLILGQARASKKIPELSLIEMKEYINHLHKIGIKFHFTLNSVWSNGIERDPDKEEIIYEEIKSIIDTGIDALIIGNLYLAEIIKSKFENIDTICSINLKTDSVYKLKSLVTEFKFNKVVLERTTNRNVSFLKNLEGIYNDKIVLLANPDCVFDCPISLYHMLENGHLSMNGNNLSNKNYCIDYCQKKYMNDYAEILKTPWIHPADMDLYENIGIKFIKIQGRTLSEERILHLTKLYLNRLETDNFTEIFPNFIGKPQNKSLYIIFDDKIFNRRSFTKTFFKNEINCKNICGLKCFKCDKFVAELERKL